MKKSEKPLFVFKIMGKTCPVYLRPNLLEIAEKMAYFDRDSFEMVVDEQLARDPKALFETILHELWHAGCRRAGVDQANEPGVEEVQCELFVTMVQEVVLPFVKSLDLAQED